MPTVEGRAWKWSAWRKRQTHPQPPHAAGRALPSFTSINRPTAYRTPPSTYTHLLHLELLDLLGLRHVGVASELGPEHGAQRDALGALVSSCVGVCGVGRSVSRADGMYVCGLEWDDGGSATPHQKQSTDRIKPTGPRHVPHAPCSRCGRPRAGSHGTAACGDGG